MEHSLRKIKSIFIKRNMLKAANLIDVILPVDEQADVTECPICEPDNIDAKCLICHGTGQMLSTTQNDEEDQRVMQELNIL